MIQKNEFKQIKDTMLKQEIDIKKSGFELYEDVLMLPEILNWGPTEQVNQLSSYWESYHEQRSMDVQN